MHECVTNRIIQMQMIHVHTASGDALRHAGYQKLKVNTALEHTLKLPAPITHQVCVQQHIPEALTRRLRLLCMIPICWKELRSSSLSAVIRPRRYLGERYETSIHCR